MTTEKLISEAVVETEYGGVKVSLAPGQGKRHLCFHGNRDACEYVSMLFGTSYGERGVLLGNSCTDTEFHFVITSTPIAELVRAVTDVAVGVRRADDRIR